MDRFVVEAERRVVGIAVRVPGGFRFVASDPDFYSMDLKVFRRARLLVSRVAELGRALRARRAECRECQVTRMTGDRAAATEQPARGGAG